MPKAERLKDEIYLQHARLPLRQLEVGWRVPDVYLALLKPLPALLPGVQAGRLQRVRGSGGTSAKLDVIYLR